RRTPAMPRPRLAPASPGAPAACGPRAGAARGARRPDSIRLLLVRIAARAHVAREALECGAHLVCERGIAAHELGRMAEVEPEQVVAHQHLAVAARTGADPDRRDRELAAHRSSEPRRDPLQHQREAAALLEQPRLAG